MSDLKKERDQFAQIIKNQKAEIKILEAKLSTEMRQLIEEKERRIEELEQDVANLKFCVREMMSHYMDVNESNNDTLMSLDDQIE